MSMSMAPPANAIQPYRPRKELTEEEQAHKDLYGKWGFKRTKDCHQCGGTGEYDNGTLCEGCICGSCTQERYYCNACSVGDLDTDSRPFSFAEDVFCFEYIEEFPSCSTIIKYRNVMFLSNALGNDIGDEVDLVTLHLTKGTFTCDESPKEHGLSPF